MGLSSPPVVKITAGYLVLKNHGKRADQLVAVSSKIARAVEMHKAIKKDGMMEMRPVKSVPIPAGGSAGPSPHPSLHLRMAARRGEC